MLGWDLARLAKTSAAFGGAIGALATASAAEAAVRDRPFFEAQGIVVVIGASDYMENGGTAPIVGDFYLLDSAPGTLATDLMDDDIVTVNMHSGTVNPSSDGEGASWEYQISGQPFGGAFISAGPHQVLNEDDAYTQFGVDGDTDIDLLGGGGRVSRFLVASNTAFDIYAEATDLVNEGAFASLGYDNIRYRLRYNVSGGPSGFRWGARAQDPAIGGAGITFSQSNNAALRWTLDDLASGPVKVFDGGRRTAASRGTLLEHAISFQSRYNLIGAGINGNNYDLSMGAGTIGATVTYTVYTP